MKEVNYQFPYLPGRLEGLGVLAYNLWFSWHSRAIQLFKCLDPKLWHDVTHNPVLLLRQIDPQRLDETSKDKSYLQQYDTVMEAFDNFMDTKETWFQKNYPEQSMNPVAYFSREFGLHECLPLYSGGLGILAGDHLKSASDNGVPLIGMGLLYRESYFTQFISLHGNQQSVFEPNNFSNLPILPVLLEDGKPLTVRARFDP